MVPSSFRSGSCEFTNLAPNCSAAMRTDPGWLISTCLHLDSREAGAGWREIVCHFRHPRQAQGADLHQSRVRGSPAMTFWRLLGACLILALGLAAADERRPAAGEAHSAAYCSIQQELAYLKLN